MLQLEWSLPKEEAKRMVLAVCRHLRQHCRRPHPCIVLDIDDTVLACRNHRVHRNEPLYFIYRYALKHGIKVFFVTARRHSFAAQLWTRQQLSLLGYDEYHGLSLMPRKFVAQRTAAHYKNLVRSTLVRQGHTLLLNAGDQWSDLMVLRKPGSAPRECPSPHRHYGIVSAGPGAAATLLVKLPNTRYVVP